MSPVDCPSREELYAYGVGKLPEQTSERVADHVRTCPKCQAALATVDDADDTLIVRLRRTPVSDPYEAESHCQEAVARVVALASTGRAAAAPSTYQPTSEPTLPDQLGEYRLLEKLGQGGMGTVYKARHVNLDRIVALKVLPKDRMKDPRAIARFYREMKAVGAVDHPNIVRAVDARQIEGTPVLVMEYAEGMDFAELVARCGPLPVADACELVRQAAIGLQGTHEHGLVHRDIKPSNLMLTPAGQVKILDLGLALLKDEPAGSASELTDTGQMMGTLDYMAPEQGADSHQVDIRADIWSLGATLYKLLTGRAPFSGKKYESRTKKMIALVTQSVPTIRQRRADLPDGLAALVDRMLARDPDERFRTPAEVAEAITPYTAGCDLPGLLSEAAQRADSVPSTEQWLPSTDQPASSALVGTQPSRPVEPQPVPLPPPRRWRRFRLAVAVAIVFFAVVLAWQIVVRIRDREGQETLVRVPEGVGVTIEQDGRRLFEFPVEAEPEKPSLSQPERPPAKQRPAPAPPVEAEKPEPKPRPEYRPLKIGPPVPRPTPVPIQIKPEPLKLEPGAPLSQTALVTQPATIEGVRSWTIETIGHRGPVNSVAYSPDGRLLATGCGDGAIRLWDADSGEFVRALLGHDGAVNSVSWSPDSKYLATGGEDKSVRLWDVRSGLRFHVLEGHSAGVLSVAWSPHGQTIASVCAEGAVAFWDPASGRLVRVLRELSGPGNKVLAWSPDGETLAGAVRRDYAVAVRLWQGASGRLAHAIASKMPMIQYGCAIAWSPDGEAIASTGNDPHPLSNIPIRVWDSRTGELRCEIGRHARGHVALAWSPDGKTLLAAGYLDSKVRLWDAETGKLVYEREKPKGAMHVPALAYSPDGRRFAVASQDSTVQVLETDSGRLLQNLAAHTGTVLSVDFSPDGKALACGNARWSVRFWDAQSGRFLAEYSERNYVRCVAYSPDASMLLVCVGGEFPTIHLWDIASGAHVSAWGGGEVRHASAFAWSPDGKRIATGGKRTTIWDAPFGKLVREITNNWGQCLAWSPDGKTLAAGGARFVGFFDLGSNRGLQSLSSENFSDVNALAWCPTGEALAYGAKMLVGVWDVESGRLLFHADNCHQSPVKSLRWLADGSTLLSGSSTEVCVWDTKSGKLHRTIPGDGGAFSPDGRLIASRGQSMVRLRSLHDGQLLRTILSLRDQQYAVISPDGHYQGSPGAEKELVYVVQTDQGEETLTPQEFAKKYGWHNDPEKVPVGDPDKPPAAGASEG